MFICRLQLSAHTEPATISRHAPLSLFSSVTNLLQSAPQNETLIRRVLESFKLLAISLLWKVTIFKCEMCVIVQAWCPSSSSNRSSSRASQWFRSCSQTCREWWEWILGAKCHQEPCPCRWERTSALISHEEVSIWLCNSNSFVPVDFTTDFT